MKKRQRTGAVQNLAEFSALAVVRQRFGLRQSSGALGRAIDRLQTHPILIAPGKDSSAFESLVFAGCMSLNGGGAISNGHELSKN